MARKNSSDKIKDLKEQMKKIEQQLKEQERKRDEELGKIFREEWGIEDDEIAHFVIDSLKSDVNKLVNTFKKSEENNPAKKNPDESVGTETEVSSPVR